MFGKRRQKSSVASHEVEICPVGRGVQDAGGMVGKKGIVATESR